MKKLLLFIAISFMGMKAVAQVPTNFLVYRQDFTGNFTDTSSYGPATSTANTATLTADEFGSTSNAGNFELGQTIEYPFASNSQLMAGPTQLSISAKVYIDPAWFAGLANNQYVTFVMLGNSYMRVLKNGGSMLLQCGVFNNNPTSGSYGYLGVQGLVDLSSGWNTVTMTYGPELPPNLGGALRVYINGVYAGNAMRAVITPDNQPASYNSATEKLVLGRAVSANQNFKGKLDRVLVYSKCLTPTEVMDIQSDKPSISTINAAGNSVSYKLRANGNATTSIVRYGTSPGSLTNSASGGGATGTGETSTSATLTGITNGVTYYYQVEATNSLGTTTSDIKSFTPGMVAQYDFDNSYADINGNNPFSGGALNGYDRFSNPNKAIVFQNIISGSSNVFSTAIIPNLPYGNSPRSISIWANITSLDTADYNHLYGYGTASSGNASGGSVGIMASQVKHLGYASNHIGTSTGLAQNTWIHYVFVYTGTQSKIYVNGVLKATQTIAWNTTNNLDKFTIGSFMGEARFFGGIDDLKIYSYAISDAEAMSLYTNNSLLATQNFQANNLKASIFPNPTSTNFTIEMETEVKSVAIYSLQGQKVLTATSKEINVSNLSKGMYLVRIEDSNNAVATQKLIVK